MDTYNLSARAGLRWHASIKLGAISLAAAIRSPSIEELASTTTYAGRTLSLSESEAICCSLGCDRDVPVETYGVVRSTQDLELGICQEGSARWTHMALGRAAMLAKG
jgi:hypothetical protein